MGMDKPGAMERRIQDFIWAFRRKKTNYLLTLLIGLFVSAFLYLRQDKDFAKDLPWLQPKLPWVAFAGIALSLIALVYRLWKTAAPPPIDTRPPLPSAIKGLLPFSFVDGPLFQRLGRRAELETLLGYSLNEQIGVSVVRGDSGAGKTSLLQAGLRYSLLRQQEAPIPCVYWEATPSDPPAALLHAIRSELRENIEIQSLDELPPSCGPRWVLILDQFEQLRRNIPEHAPIFALLERVVQRPRPHLLSVIIGFRREYDSEWLDFEHHLAFLAEKLPVNLLSCPGAEDVMAILSSEAGFTLDQGLVANFVSSVTTAQRVSPVDLAIGLLTLSNFVQQTGGTHITAADYQLAGGAEGLLLAYVQERLQEVPESVRPGLLRGLMFALVDVAKNQRLAEGMTVARIAADAELPAAQLKPWLERLAHPRVRLLEKVGREEVSYYRLPHERLIPILRRLTGKFLAELDQTRLLFEDRLAHWKRTRSSQYLLGGADLKKADQYRDALLPGEEAALRTEYFRASIRRRTLLRSGAAGVAGLALGGGVWLKKTADDALQEQKLASWDLPRRLFQVQHQIDGLHFGPYVRMNDLGWLRSRRLREFSPECRLLRNLAGLENAKGLRSLTLDLNGSPVQSLKEIEGLKGLTSLTLDLRGSRVQSLKGIEGLKGLSSLTLDLRGSQVRSLKEIEGLKGLSSLTLDLRGSQFQSLKEIEGLRGLTSLTLDVSYFKEIEGLKGLTSLILDLRPRPLLVHRSLKVIEGMKDLTSLTMHLGGSQVQSLKEIEGLKGLTSLTLDLSGSQVQSLKGIEGLKRLTSLTLDLRDSQVRSLREIEGLTLTSLTLDLRDSRFQGLARIEGLKGLTSLTLDLRGSEFQSLKWIEGLKGLTSLTLDLIGSQLQSLKEIDSLPSAKSLEIRIDPTLLDSAQKLQRPDRVSLWVSLPVGSQSLPELPARLRFLGLSFE